MVSVEKPVVVNQLFARAVSNLRVFYNTLGVRDNWTISQIEQELLSELNNHNLSWSDGQFYFQDEESLSMFILKWS